MSNLFKRFTDLLPQRPLQVGEVIDSSDGVSTVELPGGNSILARGSATIGSRVFVRDGVIEGTAPSLTVVQVEV